MSRRLFMVISLVIFFIGLFIVFSSVSWGYNAANAYLRSQGGSMDSTQFAIILQENINMYRWIGSILSVISGLGLVKVIEVR
jgi:hypothetical protein